MSSRCHPVRALISQEALRANAERIAVQGRTVFADLRDDAWGHGVVESAAVVHAAGLGVLIDERDRALLNGLDDDAIASDAAVPLADPDTLWGFPGGEGRAVMSLAGSVLSTKRLRQGEGVSYGYTFRAERDSIVALVTGGYAQGVLRELGNRARVGVRGGFARIVGRVAMDACVVELAGVDAEPGDGTVFFGDPERGEPSLTEWTEATRLSAAEIVSLVGARAQRRRA